MDDPWKKVKDITLRSVSSLEDLTTWLEDMRDCEKTLSQSVGTSLGSVILQAGCD
jgi:hypothetical protein